FSRRFREPGRFVISHREIETDCMIGGIDCECSFVLIDRFFVLPESRISSAEIRTHIDARRMRGENRQVRAHCSLQVAALVQLSGALKIAFDGVWSLRRNATDKQSESDK